MSKLQGSSPTIAHRQEVIDHLIEELWPHLAAGKAALAQEPASNSGYSAFFGDSFVLDWGRSASDDLIRQFSQGWNRTPKQLRNITATWELRRGWNHGDTPDNSLYTKRIIEEALWLRRLRGWTLQDVVDIVITFCRKHQLRWSFGRAKKQITDGEQYILAKTRRKEIHISASPVTLSLAHHLDPDKLTPEQLDKIAEHLLAQALAGKSQKVVDEARRRIEAGEPVTVEGICREMGEPIEEEPKP
jgi:hypothetical protein